MIREFTIENFKSIENLTLPLGRVTVLIGENGAGKSNVLEGMAFLAATAQSKLNAEFLHSRGVRAAPGPLPLSAFKGTKTGWRRHSFYAGATAHGTKANCAFIICGENTDEGTNHDWAASAGKPREDQTEVIGLSLTHEELKKILEVASKLEGKKISLKKQPDLHFLQAVGQSQLAYANELRRAAKLFPTPFVIYSPENTALRTFEAEGQMRPLGVRGEGLFKLVQHFAEHQPAKFKLLRKELKLFDWFEDFAIPKRLGIGESRLEIKDRFLAAKRLLDQRSANEGFLFLLFYLCLFLSPQTPKFFAIDNIDASLNPKLCAEMMRRLVALAKQEDKQVIITTHNPAILDGLDLTDKEQLLYAVQRDSKGRTSAQRIAAPKPQRGESALKLSHAYLRGLLGGVPKNF
ncbi:MAG: AAA family ATPase [Verrucomicrobiaceae bacterium]|nr:AAA family ATPase [Verrucomicrobiaceae bacterium]